MTAGRPLLVGDVMAARPVTVDPADDWRSVASCMLVSGAGALPVVDDDGFLLGIVTEADLLSRAAFNSHHHPGLESLVDLVRGEGRWVQKSVAVTAAELMTTAVHVTTPDDDLGSAARRMLEHGVHHLPVLDAGRLVGVVSRRDILAAMEPAAVDLAAEDRPVPAPAPGR